MRTLQAGLAALGAVLLATAPGASAELSQQKRELIRELVEASGGAISAEEVNRMLLMQFKQVYGSWVEQLVADDPTLTPEERQAMRAHLGDFDWFSKTFSARFAERIDLARVLERAYFPFYDRYFEESELKELLAFYRTPTGKKAVSVLPAIMHEGMEATQPLLQPQVAALMAEILAERSAELESAP
jgi:hypothetical protein